MIRKVVPGILILLMVLFIFYKGHKEISRLHHNFQVGTGEIIDIETFYNSGGQIFVIFITRVGKDDITSKTSIFCEKKNKPAFKKYLIGKKLEIVYEKTDPDNCEMLLTREGYETYKLVPSKASAIILDSINSICSNNN
jgi:hypothetical protein